MEIKENKMTPLYIYDPMKKKKVKVGAIINDYYYKPVIRRKHYLRIVSGYAIQESVIKDIVGKISKIVIEELDTGKRFSISMGDFLMHSSRWSHEHGRQLTIEEKYLEEDVHANQRIYAETN